MDPRDHLRALPDGLVCTVCDETVPAERIRLLARREDLSFIQVDCLGCGSTSLEFVADPDPDAVSPMGSEAVTADDVRGMRDFLDGWTGDLRTLVTLPPRARGLRVARRSHGGNRS